MPDLITEHSQRIRKLIDFREEDEVGRIQAEFEQDATKLERLENELTAIRLENGSAKTKAELQSVEGEVTKLEKQRDKAAAKIAERDARIRDVRRRADDDRQDISKVGDELIALYKDSDELLKHARVVGISEVEENDFNLNVPRYVDTFEPEQYVPVEEARRALAEAEEAAKNAAKELTKQLGGIGYARTDAR